MKIYSRIRWVHYAATDEDLDSSCHKMIVKKRTFGGVRLTLVVRLSIAQNVLATSNAILWGKRQIARNPDKVIL